VRRKIDPFFVEEEARFLGEKNKSWSRISRRMKPGMTVLAKVRSNFTGPPKFVEIRQFE
jgi:hypothetical protein